MDPCDSPAGHDQRAALFVIARNGLRALDLHKERKGFNFRKKRCFFGKKLAESSIPGLTGHSASSLPGWPRQKFTSEMYSFFAAVANAPGDFSQRLIGLCLCEFENHGKVNPRDYFDSRVPEEH